MKENIEYKKGWQIEKNGSPESLHNKFSDDKIKSGIDSTGNIGMAESDKTYKAKIGDKWLKGHKLVDKDEADTFESKTEPTQRYNQMKKDGKKVGKLEIIELDENIYESIYNRFN